MRFILASASPARLDTLRAAGVEPEVIVSGVDESSVQAPDTMTLVKELAILKSATVRDTIHGDALVLGCDSMFEFEGEPLGKPGSSDEARTRWKRMRGRWGMLWTGHCLYDTIAGRLSVAMVSTRVNFADITDDELELYLGSGEPSNVAGAFTVDGYGGWFVESIQGDHHNVVGLSLPTLRKMLRELNYSLSDIGYPAC